MGLNVIVHYPTTDEGLAELSKRVATAHAEIAYKKIKDLRCPTKQKIQLMDAIIGTCRNREKE